MVLEVRMEESHDALIQGLYLRGRYTRLHHRCTLPQALLRHSHVSFFHHKHVKVEERIHVD